MGKKLFTLLDLCVSSLRRGHANLLCIVPILTDDPRRESRKSSGCMLDWANLPIQYAQCSLLRSQLLCHIVSVQTAVDKQRFAFFQTGGGLGNGLLLLNRLA